MNIERDDIEAIVSSVWESVLEMPLTPTERDGTYQRAASVDIMGLWNGSVMVEIEREMLRRAAGAMFEVDLKGVTEFQMTDALAEITNIVGGNVKCLLEHPTKLSLPSVQTVDLEAPLGEVDQIVRFRDDWGGDVRVKLIRVQ
ncbi:MAG: chemotaxis protein CheX [Myxococcales bacterium]|nr:chemotaxis protein CheX [Myxococcales bacterium]